MLSNHIGATTRIEATVAFVDDLVDYAIVVLDASGRVLTWNAGAEVLLGYKSDEVVGQRISDSQTNLDVAAIVAGGVLNDAVTWGRHETTRRLVRKGGQQFEAHIILRPVRDAAHRVQGYGIVLRGIDAAVHSLASEAFTDRPNVLGQARRSRILVVDDDDLVRVAAEEQLSSLGYEVVMAASATEALAIVAGDDDLDMLFTDVVMHNGLGGAALAEQVQRIRPELPILFASGYLQSALQSTGQLPAGMSCIVKPYRRAELARKIEGILAFRVRLSPTND